MGTAQSLFGQDSFPARNRTYALVGPLTFDPPVGPGLPAISWNTAKADLAGACAVQTPNHGRYVSCVTRLGNALRKTGVISGSDKGAIQSGAARSSIGNY